MEGKLQNHILIITLDNHHGQEKVIKYNADQKTQVKSKT